MNFSTPVRATSSNPSHRASSNLVSRYSGSEMDKSEAFPILSLPHCVISVVLGHLSYDQVAQMRIVCRSFDTICKRHLNKGFRQVERFHGKCLKEIKAKLPRRESVRRNHMYARHSDILSAIETRISLLSMTFMKYVDLNLCCFIPGKVIDEIFRVLRIIKEEQNPPRAYEILQELRDISSMAMEHFDEKIVPSFKMNKLSLNTSSASIGLSPSKMESAVSFLSPGLAGLLDSPASSPCPSTSLASVGSIVQDVVTVQHKRVLGLIKKNRKQFTLTQKIVAGMKGAQNDQRAKIAALERVVTSQENLLKTSTEKIKEQEVIVAAQSEKLKEMDTRLLELSQLMVEYDRKLSELTQQQNAVVEQPEPEAAGTTGRKRKSPEMTGNKGEKRKKQK